MVCARVRAVCEHGYMLAVSFFLLWHVLYMTEAGWTFDAMEGFPAACAALAGISLLLCRFRWGSAWLGAGLLAWMAAACLIRDAHLLQLQWEPISRGMLAFLVMLPAARIVKKQRFEAWLRGILAVWTACFTLQAAIGLWAALTGHAVFSLRGTWYIGVNLGDHRLYLNAYVTTGAAKMGLSVLLAAVGAAMCRSRMGRAGYALCALVQLMCLSLTDCRTAFIALGAMAGLTGAVLLMGLPVLARRAAWLRLGAMALAALVLLAAVYLGMTGMLTLLAPHVPAQLENIPLTELPGALLPAALAEDAAGVAHRGLDAGNLFNSRQHIWRAALRMLWYQPECLLHGATSVMAYGMTNLYLDAEAGMRFSHVHNIYLQTLVNWGVPGLLLLLALVVLFLRAAARVMPSGAPLWQRMAPTVPLYVLLCELVDCFTRLSEPSPMLLFACLFAGMTIKWSREVKA